MDMCETETVEKRLIHAAGTGDLCTVRKILKAPGAFDIDYRDEMGKSAILVASQGGHAQIVKLLIEHNCYINNPTGLLVRPIHVAAIRNHSEVLKLLLNAGAAPDAKTNDGYTPLQYTSFRSESYTLLQNHKPDKVYDVVEKENFMPEVPQHAVQGGEKKTVAKDKKGKKGKKGEKKGGKKGGGKKKGGKKKKK